MESLYTSFASQKVHQGVFDKSKVEIYFICIFHLQEVEVDMEAEAMVEEEEVMEVFIFALWF